MDIKVAPSTACLLTLTGLFFGSRADAIVIDHSSIAGVSSYSQSLMNEIGQQRWLFTHASVGGNIVGGLNSLHATNATRYQLTTESWGTKGSQGSSNYSADNAPSTTVNGTVYEVQRGNPDWSNKVTCFANSLKSTASGGGGWADKVDIAVDKFCWIDPYANVDTYLNSMSAQESLYPDLKLVYSTMPLTGDTDGENDLRNAFNDAVRAYCSGNDRLLYDIADIEAWSTGGVEQTYVSGGHTYQKMWLGYAVSDGDWHLNSVGQNQAALGWYATGAQAVPEPATVIGLSVLVLGAIVRKRQKR
jgi:hypothetical protein